MNVFSLAGRYGRKRYWLGALGLLVLMILMLVAFAPMMSSAGGGSSGFVMIAVLAIPFLWLYAKLIIHRLHDLNVSGWLFLLLGPLLVPLPIWMWIEAHTQHAADTKMDFPLEFGGYAIFLGGFILLGCRRGTRGENSYGPDPVPPAEAP